MSAGLQHDRLTGRAWLTFVSKPDAETISTLKAAGWRWSGYRQAWHKPGRHTKPPTGIEYQDDGECDFAAQRSERLEERANKRQAESNRRFEGVRRIADNIPFGQPILVGHHSERHARKDAERIHTGMGKAIELGREADQLRYKAGASERHQEHLQDPRTVSRRLEGLRAELRKVERYAQAPRCRHGHQLGLCIESDCDNTADTSKGRFTHFDERIANLKDDIARCQEQLEAAGVTESGLTPALAAQLKALKPGDICLIRGRRARVTKVNRKTISGVLLDHPLTGWKVKDDFCRFGGLAPGCDGEEKSVGSGGT